MKGTTMQHTSLNRDHSQNKWMVFLTPETSLDIALDLLKQTNAQALPVLNQGQYVGVVFRDELMWYAPSPATTLSRWEYPELLQTITLGAENLIRQVPKVLPHAALSDLLGAMGQSTNPVIAEVDGDRLYRLITWHDVLQSMADNQTQLLSA
jgi:acetoin utilization protein AcuB